MRQLSQRVELVARNAQLLENRSVQKLLLFTELDRSHTVPQVGHVSVIDNRKHEVPPQRVWRTENYARPQAEENARRAEEEAENNQAFQVIGAEVG